LFCELGFFDFLQAKALPAKTQVFLLDGISSNLIRNLEAYVTEGYGQSPIVYACVQTLMKAVSSVKLEVHTAKGDKTKVETTHPILSLLAKPNPTQSGKDFLHELVMWHRVAGEAFVLKVPASGDPKELYLLDPRKLTVKKRREGGLIPECYEYGDGEGKVIYPVNALTGASQVLHIKTPNPNDAFRGLSPLSAGARPVDTHNSGWKWNAALLNNSARPSGYVEVQGAPEGDTLAKLREFFKKAWQGSQNAGNIPVLTAGMKFQQLSHNPKDMDFEKSMAGAAKDVALVYGVPLPLVTNDAATFSNMDAALERLWSDTVLPLLDEIIKPLSDFLLGAGDGKSKQTLAYNSDSVPALEAKRARLFDRMVKAVSADILTVDEARAEMGYAEYGGKAGELSVDREQEAVSAEAALEKALRRVGYSEADVKRMLEDDFGLTKAS